jgi:hypothetical protein
MRVFEPQRGYAKRDMCRPAGARFATDGIGYKYVAPLGLNVHYIYSRNLIFNF